MLPFPARISGSTFLPPEFLCGFPPLPRRSLLLPVGILGGGGVGGGGRRPRSGRPVEMAGGKEPIEVKFRLFDGTDIGPSKYDPSTTVAALKEFVLARWPQGEETCRLLCPLFLLSLLYARFSCVAYIYSSARLMPAVSGGCLFRCPAFTRSAVREQETPFRTMVLVDFGVRAVSFRAAICLQSKTRWPCCCMEWDA